MDKSTNLLSCPTVYGPKKSRRQGLSLGINLGDPDMKCCTWSCVYCQCGFGRKADGSGRYPSRNDIVRVLVHELNRHAKLDSVTIAGNSEPGTYPEFLELVKDVIAVRKKMSGNWIFNCLTNGSELDNERVRQACELLDEAWVKIDCATDQLLLKVNRPLARIGGIKGHLDRVKKLQSIRIQTLLWRDTDQTRRLGNDTEDNFVALLDAFKFLQPKQIHLTTIQREPATKGLEPLCLAELNKFADRVRLSGLEIAVYE